MCHNKKKPGEAMEEEADKKSSMYFSNIGSNNHNSNNPGHGQPSNNNNNPGQGQPPQQRAYPPAPGAHSYAYSYTPAPLPGPYTYQQYSPPPYPYAYPPPQQPHGYPPQLQGRGGYPSSYGAYSYASAYPPPQPTQGYPGSSAPHQRGGYGSSHGHVGSYMDMGLLAGGAAVTGAAAHGACHLLRELCEHGGGGYGACGHGCGHHGKFKHDGPEGRRLDARSSITWEA